MDQRKLCHADVNNIIVHTSARESLRGVFLVSERRSAVTYLVGAEKRVGHTRARTSARSQVDTPLWVGLWCAVASAATFNFRFSYRCGIVTSQQQQVSRCVVETVAFSPV